MKEASFYTKLYDGRVRCQLCAHYCETRDGQAGICKVRQNQGGKLICLTYGQLIAAHADPIEKKPLFHFLPGSAAYSIASPGCNLRCAWCQNWEISQADGRLDFELLPYTTPESVVRAAISASCESIAYTYTEPTVFYEYAKATGKLAKDAGLKNIFVTNGFLSQESLADAATWLDAANIDLKAFSEEAYRKFSGARLEPVKTACKALKAQGVWVEITTLLVPGVNDDQAQLEGMAAFIAQELGVDTPWHLSRYFPQYKFSAPATPIKTMEDAIRIGEAAGLRYIYTGNVHQSATTHCPTCGKALISRSGYTLQRDELQDGSCPACNTKIAGDWAGDLNR